MTWDIPSFAVGGAVSGLVFLIFILIRVRGYLDEIERHKLAGAYMLNRLDNPVATERVRRILQGKDTYDSACPGCGKRGLFPGLDELYQVGDTQTCKGCGAECVIDWDGEEGTPELKRFIGAYTNDSGEKRR